MAGSSGTHGTRMRERWRRATILLTIGASCAVAALLLPAPDAIARCADPRSSSPACQAEPAPGGRVAGKAVARDDEGRHVWTTHIPLAVRRTWRRPPPRRLTWGTQFILEGYPRWHDDDVAVELPRARRSGLRGIRTNLRWDTVEPENTTPDAFDWSEPDARMRAYTDEGFDLLITVVAYPPWATVYGCGYALRPGMEAEWRQFVRAAAQHFAQDGHDVVAWEIGNEPDGVTTVGPEDWARAPAWGRGEPTTPYGGCWGDRPAAYARFVGAAYEELKSVDPEARVTAGSLGFAPGFHLDFLDRYLEAGGGAAFDFLGLHWFPDARYEPQDGVERYRSLRDTLSRHGVDAPVWLTETYRLTHPEIDGSEARQIGFLTRELVQILAQPSLERVYWYGWIDLPEGVFDGVDDWERGIVRSDHTPKAALRILPDTMSHTDGTPSNLSTSDVVAYRFAPDGRGDEHIVAWSRDGRPRDLVIRAPGPGLVTVRRYPDDMLLDGRCCAFAQLTPRDGVVAVTVGEDARFITLPGRRASSAHDRAGSG